jgi:hypothetical protein
MAYDKTVPVITNTPTADIAAIQDNFEALWPYTTAGDLAIGAGATAALTRLAVGTNGQVLKVVAGAPAWATDTATGDVVGPESAVADNVATFDTTTGKLIKDSGIASADLYMAGGTDVPVADGGTGRSSHTAYAVLCGGTTTTSAQQSIASVGTSGQVLTSNGAGALPTFQDAAAGGASFWTQTTGTFTATPASTSTLTMGTDLTATIKVGYPLKYAIGGTTYYGIVTAITSNLLTVAGAPLGGDVTALYYGNPERIIQATYAVNGYFADGANTTLLQTDLLTDEKWTQAKAYLAMISHIVGTDDSGANQPRVTAYVNGAAVGTSNTNAGEEVAETWTDTVVAINTSNYDVNYGETVEIATDANGSNNDAQNLTVKLTWVLA